MARTSLYHAEPHAAHRLVATAEMTLLFHRPSGETHLLAEPMPDILALLGERADTVDGVTSRLCDRLGESEDEEARTVVAHRLDELEAVGLVWRD